VQIPVVLSGDASPHASEPIPSTGNR